MTMLAISPEYKQHTNMPLLPILAQISMLTVRRVLLMLELANTPRITKRVDLIADQALYGYPGLMAAIVYQAKEEAEGGSIEALSWLSSDYCADYCMAIGFDHNVIRRWADKKRVKVERLQKMTDRIEELKSKIADQKGLPGVFTEWLRGDTEEQIRADADRLIDFIRPQVLHDKDQGIDE